MINFNLNFTTITNNYITFRFRNISTTKMTIKEIEIVALFYSITTTDDKLSTETKMTTSNKKKEQSLLTSYMAHPSETIKRFIFGIHSKTKRSLAEEAESGDELSVTSWIREGADPNEQDAYGYTPLLNASANGRLKAVKNLIRNGADISIRGPYGYTALHAAAQVII